MKVLTSRLKTLYCANPVTVFVSLVITAVLFAFMGYLFWMGKYELVIRIIEIVSSWQIVSLIVLIIFFFKFSKAINTFIEEIINVKFGNNEITRKKEQRTAEGKQIENIDIQKNLKDQGITLSQQQIEEISSTLQNLQENVNNLDQQRDEAIKLAKYLFGRAEYYEFLYLNTTGFVLNTKATLYWLYKQKDHQSTIDETRTAIKLPESFNSPDSEKNAIIGALITNGMVSAENNIITTTDKGERFLKFSKSI